MTPTTTVSPASLLAYSGDQNELRRAYGAFPTGVAALSAVVDGEAVVLVASSFQVGVSLDPPLVMLAVQHTSTSWPVLRGAARIGVSVLGGSHAGAAVRLASRAARNERFSGVETATAESGAHFIEASPLWLECSFYSEMRAGDHDVVVLQVHAIAEAGHEPLVWHASTFRALAPGSIAD